MLLASDAAPWSGSWWPDGRSVIYATYGDDFQTQQDGSITATTSLWRLDLQNRGRRLLAEQTGESVIANPVVSPAGDHVAYLDGRHWQVLRTAGGEARQITASFGAREADWSPDGQWLAFARFAGNDAEGRWEPEKRGLWLWPVTGDEPTQIVSYPDDAGAASGRRMCSPHWSPNGSWIAFSWLVEESSETRVQVEEVWLVRADGSGPHQIAAIRHAPRGYSPLLGRQCWSPDGRSLVLAWSKATASLGSGETAHGGSSVEAASAPGGVQILDTGTRRFAVLVAPDTFPSSDWCTSRPAWAPNGRDVAYVARDAARRSDKWCPRGGSLYVVSVPDGLPAAVDTTREVSGPPLWSPDSASLLYLCRGACEPRGEGPPRCELRVAQPHL